MHIYFAPLEGITGYVFRNAYEKYYGGIDKYFTPFISPHTKKLMDTREKRESTIADKMNRLNSFFVIVFSPFWITQPFSFCKRLRLPHRRPTALPRHLQQRNRNRSSFGW